MSVAPAEIYFTYRDDDQRHTLAEVLQLRENQWFSKGVALSQECNEHIVDASIQYLDLLRQGGTRHQIIAVACSVDHARQIASLYRERGRTAREIHSQMTQDERDDVLLDLRNGRIDAIIQVRILGEGFDHPLLSVAAIFNPFRSLSPYIQFVGRIMRVVHQNAPNHPDNEGIVVSHVGLNVDQHWDDFRDIDAEDEELLRRLVTPAEDSASSLAERLGGRRRLTPEMIVQNEIVERFIQSSYLDPEDDAVIDDLLAALEARGLDPEALGLSRDELRRRISSERDRHALTPQRATVTPQRRRQETRRRLSEQSRTLASRVLKDLGGAVTSRRFTMLYPELRASNDLALVTQLINAELNRVMGVDAGARSDVSSGVLEEGISALEDVGNRVAAELRRRSAENAGGG